MFDYIKRKCIEQRMYYEAFENDASYDEKNPMAKWDSGLWIRYKLFENVLASIPSADVIEPKRGKWETVFMSEATGWDVSIAGRDPIYGHRCSICKEETFCNDVGEEMLTNFCPYCGADMRERKGE